MNKDRRVFSREFKLDVIERSYRCDSIKDLALELDLRPELVYRWRAEYAASPSISFPGQGTLKQTPHEEEVSRLRRELADVKMERDILKKALGIFTNPLK